MNPQASYVPFIPEGLPIPQYGYGGVPPGSQNHRSGHAPRPEVPAPPPLSYPPLLVPVYPFHPIGYPNMYPQPNYTMYHPPTENPIPSPSSSYYASSQQSNPPFLPPNTPRASRSHHYYSGSYPCSHHYHPGSRHSASTSSPTINNRTHSEARQYWVPPLPTTWHKSGPTPSVHPLTTPTAAAAAAAANTTTTTRRVIGRYGIHELLNCQLNSHPYIDWVIYNDLSLARQWVIGSSGTERCQSVGFEGLAVVPPVNNLSIRTRGLHTPVGQAIERWGDIRVCRFDRFLSIGDVLHEIWAYFDAPLTEGEKATMRPPFSQRVEVSFQKRWDAQGKSPEQAVKRRCDTLFDCVRFAGLDIALDFETCRELYLSLEISN